MNFASSFYCQQSITFSASLLMLFILKGLLARSTVIKCETLQYKLKLVTLLLTTRRRDVKTKNEKLHFSIHRFKNVLVS